MTQFTKFTLVFETETQGGLLTAYLVKVSFIAKVDIVHAVHVGSVHPVYMGLMDLYSDGFVSSYVM